MNERIRHLAEQSIPVDPDGNKVRGLNSDYHTQWMDKFAELIVKECAGIYDKIDNGNLHMGTENYPEALQKHFGIER